MSDLTFGLFVRGQYHAGDDMTKRFEEVKAQVRLADRLGFSDLLTGMHYAAAPLQMGFNWQYLLDFLAASESENILLEFKDEQSAGQLRPASEEKLRYRYVVMPMRI